jgi:hypothetical protein
MIKTFNLVFYIFLALLSIQLDGQTCNAPPYSKSPGGDNCDENYSNASIEINDPVCYSLNPEIFVLKNGFYREAINLISKLKHSINIFNGNEIYYNSGSMKQMIIPTGGLYGKKNDSTLKYLLEQFVSKGGVILCYAQQDSSDYIVLPVPPGETLHCHGWRNIQSCLHGSIYFSQAGPIFSGQTSQRISAGVDGGFSSFPTGTEVLIRRTSNQEPAMIAYPYGENGGMVYLSATYPDWSLAHGACTLSELKLVRDLVSYLKSPHLFIPMFDVSMNPTVQVQLNVKIKNTTEFTASKALLKSYTPFRDRVVYESEQSITLPPGGESEVPISFTLTDVQTEELGIYGTYYQLFDEDGNQVLNSVESDSGRFAIYKTPNPYVPKEQCQYWLEVDNEEVHWADPVSFVLHARNYTDTEKQVEFKYEWNHEGTRPLTTLTLPPGETVEYSFEKKAAGVMF